MKKIYHITSKVTEVLGLIAGIFIFLMAVFQTYGSVVRYIFNSSTRWSLDFTRYAMLLAVFLSGSYALIQGSHVGITILTDALKKRSSRILVFISEIITFVYPAIVIFYGMQRTISYYNSGARTIALIQLPLWIFYLVIVLGFAAILVVHTIMFINKYFGDSKNTLKGEKK